MKPVGVCLALFVAIIQVVTADNFACSESGRFAVQDDTTCEKYYSCKVGTDGKWVKIKYDCPLGTLFDEKLRRCTSIAKCSKDSSDSSGSADSSYEDGEFVCKKAGLFDDVKDPACSNYYECKKNHHGDLYAVQYPCPQPSRFDPKAKSCSYSYICTRHFQCLDVGRFDDTTDENNKRYFLCLKRKSGELVEAMYTCPLYSRFDQINNICVIPDESLSDEIEVHDNTLPVEDWHHDKFICAARGFFTNSADNTCKSFYFCDVNRDGTFTKHVLACPQKYGWNRETNLCTYGHSC